MEKLDQNINLYTDFLKLLGIKKKRVSLEALSELVLAHFSTIPFENISKLYYKRRFNLEYIPEFSVYLNGISEHCFGGTCYSNNYYFYKLLIFLGFDAKLCGADMIELGSHMVIVVTLNDENFLVDVGYAAPFINPIPLYLKSDHTVLFGQDKYIIKPYNNEGCSRLEMYRNGVYKHGYIVNPNQKKIEDFSQVISNSFNSDSTFLNSILITKYISGSFITVHNFELIESNQKKSSITKISDSDELYRLIEKIFNIPAAMTGDIYDSVNSLDDAWI